jgi:aminotransferase EvaB
MKVRFSYLKQKFANTDAIWERIKKTVAEGDFTLGKEVQEFERRFAEKMGVKYAVGVANGTDALILSLWALGVRAGDEVIAPANTFVASLGAIGLLQAKPVLVDVGPDYVMDVSKVEEAITPKTKAIMPVHFCGNPVDMSALMEIADRRGIPVVEDACQAFLARHKGKCVGNFGKTGCFSLHPLKILNVWGDGGVITTNDGELYKSLKLLQNHGMQTRDHLPVWPCYNSRLDSVHAAVANHQIDGVPAEVRQRRTNAAYYDLELSKLAGVHVIERVPENQSVFHLYFFEVSAGIRDQLYQYLQEHGVDAKIHYPVPLYLQPGLVEKLGHIRGDFPAADAQCDRIITIPVDELLTWEQREYVVATIKNFFADRYSGAI